MTIEDACKRGNEWTFCHVRSTRPHGRWSAMKIPSSDSRHHVAGAVDILYRERVGLLNPALFSHLPSMDQSLFEYEGRGDGERSGHATPWG